MLWPLAMASLKVMATRARSRLTPVAPLGGLVETTPGMVVSEPTVKEKSVRGRELPALSRKPGPRLKL